MLVSAGAEVGVEFVQLLRAPVDRLPRLPEPLDAIVAGRELHDRLTQARVETLPLNPPVACVLTTSLGSSGQ